MTDRCDRLDAALAKHGVSLCEYQAMICPYYEIPVGLEVIGAYTLAENEAGCGCCGTLFTPAQYLDAIREMIAKGWLRLRSREVAARMAGRPDAVPHRQDECPGPMGSVEFTRRGYLLHRRIWRDARGLHSMQQMESLKIVDPSRHQVHFYAQSSEVCRDWILAVRQVYGLRESVSDLVDAPVEIVRIRGPLRIGKWRPSRFLTLPRGYHVVVSYRRLRRRRVNWPELDTSGWVSRLRPVRVEGKTGPGRFGFSDSPFFTDPSCDDRFVHFTWGFYAYRGDGTAHQYEVEETPTSMRRKPLTVEDALAILRRCVEAFRLAVTSENR